MGKQIRTCEDTLYMSCHVKYVKYSIIQLLFYSRIAGIFMVTLELCILVIQ